MGANEAASLVLGLQLGLAVRFWVVPFVLLGLGPGFMVFQPCADYVHISCTDQVFLMKVVIQKNKNKEIKSIHSGTKLSFWLFERCLGLTSAIHG